MGVIPRPAHFAGIVGWLTLIACGGFGGDVVAPACCSVDDVLRLTADGVTDEVIIDAIRTSRTDLDLSADDLTRLTEGGVSPPVIDVLNGGPCVCEVIPEPSPQPGVEPSPRPEPSGGGLNVTVKYSGGKSFELVNLSKNEYTGLEILVNGEYQYRLKRLPPNSGDFVRLSSFVSRTTGAEPKGVKVERVQITADQGTYSRSF